MSKTVKIPSTSNPWKCVINNTTYVYEAGSEQTVPDEVADIIEAQNEFPPAAPEVDKPFPAGGGGGAVVVHLSVGVVDDQEVIIADKTPQDAWDAMVEGKVVTGVFDMVGRIMPLGTCGLYNGNASTVCFLMDGNTLIEGGVGEDWIFGG